MDFKQSWSKIVGAIKDYVAKEGGSEKAAKVASQINSSNVGKVFASVALVNFIDSTVGDVIGKVVKGPYEMSKKALDTTIGQIPGVKEVYKVVKGVSEWVDKTIGGLLMPRTINAAYNSPRIYEHAFKEGLNFSLPALYDNGSAELNGSDIYKFNVPSVITFNLALPIGVSSSDMKTRAGHIYDIVTIARGLNNTVYDQEDVIRMNVHSMALLKLYVKLKKLLSVKNAESALKANMPNALIRQLGFDPAEVEANASEYMTTFNDLVDKANKFGFIYFGEYASRILDTQYLLKDSQLRCATYINEEIALDVDESAGMKIWSQMKLTGRIKQAFPAVAPNGTAYMVGLAGLININMIKGWIKDLFDDIQTNTVRRKLRTDVMSVFGKSCILTLDTKLYNIYNTASNDILQLYSLKNAELALAIHPLLAGLHSSSGTETEYHTDMSIDMAFIKYDLTKDYTVIEKDWYADLANTCTATFVAVPETNNSKSALKLLNTTTTFPDTKKPFPRVKTIHKDQVEKGEAFEMVSFTNQIVANEVSTFSNSGKGSYSRTVVAPVFAVLNMLNDLDYTGALHDSLCTKIAYTTFADLQIAFGSSPLNAAVWATIDYMPDLVLVDETTNKSIDLWDVDNIAEFSELNFTKAVTTCTYSLWYLQWKAITEKGKQVQAAVDLYQ